MKTNTSEFPRTFMDRAYDAFRILAFITLSMIYGLIIGGLAWGYLKDTWRYLWSFIG